MPIILYVYNISDNLKAYIVEEIAMIPKWLEKRYKILWDEYHDKDFRFEDTTRTLKENMQDSKDQINV